MDIIRLPIEYKAESADSRFRLVLMAAQRARQISEGATVLVKSKYVKNTTLALEETIEGKLRFLTGDEAGRAREYEYRMRRERLARQSMEESSAAALDRMEEIKAAYKAETELVELGARAGAGAEESDEDYAPDMETEEGEEEE